MAVDDNTQHIPCQAKNSAKTRVDRDNFIGITGQDLMVREEPSRGEDVVSGVSGEVYNSPETMLSGPTCFQSGEGAEAFERIIPSSPESAKDKDVLWQGASDRNVKRQEVLEHKAEEWEHAREFGNAPEDPFDGKRLSGQRGFERRTRRWNPTRYGQHGM